MEIDKNIINSNKPTASKKTIVSQQDYEAWRKEKEYLGLEMTSKRKSHFLEGAGALDEDVKQKIVNSFDCEADYTLQAELAQLYKDDHSLSTKEFKDKAKKMYGEENVTVEKVKTHIINDKGKATTATVQLISVRDPETGAEIKIIDSNGNGEIEVEELFLNELLSGISMDIDKNLINSTDKVNALSNGSTQASESGSSGLANNIAGKTNAENPKQKTASSGKTLISAAQYESLKAKFQEKFKNGLKYDKTAILMAADYMKTHFEVSDNAQFVNEAEILNAA